MKEAAKRYRENHPDRILLQNKPRADYKKNRKLKAVYGISLDEYNLLRGRQHNKCLGCQELFKNNKQICVDHDHKTGEVRGLLCTKCNWALGNVNDSQEILYRLAAYLTYDRKRLGCYVIGSLRNPEIPIVGDSLRRLDFDVYDHWASVGEKADDAWQAYETDRGRNYREALKGRSAKNVYHFDKAYLDLADIAIMVLPAGRSANLELGYIKGSGKPSYILTNGEDVGRFEVMPNFVDEVFYSIEEMINTFKELYTKNNDFICSNT